MNFSDWVLSIVGVVLITLLVDVLLPEGETNKYVKSIFSVVTVLLIVSPFPKILHGDVTFLPPPETQIETDADFLEYLYDVKVKTLTKDLEKRLLQEGYDVTLRLQCENRNQTPVPVEIFVSGQDTAQISNIKPLLARWCGVEEAKIQAEES